MGNRKDPREKTEDFNFDEDDTLVDDRPDDGFALIDDDSTAPEDRRRDPMRRPA